MEGGTIKILEKNRKKGEGLVLRTYWLTTSLFEIYIQKIFENLFVTFINILKITTILWQ